MFRILSIDGGGVRGIFPAYLLKLLSADLSRDLGEIFDLIVGTSTGSFIAAAIASGISPDQVVQLYETEAPNIFGNPRSTLKGTVQSKYSSAPLRRVATEIFGTRLLGHLSKRLVLPATDISNGNVFVMKSPYLPEFVRDKDIQLHQL
jgi:patatin-like phospholipase/acyl hydrolase